MMGVYRKSRLLDVLTVLVVSALIVAFYCGITSLVLGQEPPPEDRRLLFTDPTPPSTCDLEELISLSRAALEKPKDADARKKALDVIDKCDRVFKAWKTNISRAPEQQEP